MRRTPDYQTERKQLQSEAKKHRLEWLKFLATVITGAISLGAFALGVSQYIATEKWKEKEFVSKEIKAFLDDPINKTVFAMLDYQPLDLVLSGSSQPAKSVRVDFETISAAFANDDTTPDQNLIRQYFEHFFQGINRLDYYIHQEIIKPADFCPDFAYWALIFDGKTVGTDKEPRPYAKSLKAFHRRWDNTDVEHFIRAINEVCPRQSKS